MLDARWVLLLVAAILVLFTVRGYWRHRRLLLQHRIWLIVAGIFVLVSLILAA